MDNTTFRPVHGHLPPASGSAPGGLFERDDLFLAERLRELRAAAGRDWAVRQPHDGLLGRARRSLGSGLIALGSAVAGARLGAGQDEAMCEDCGISAAA